MRLITEDDDKDVDSDAISMDCDNDFVEPQTQLDLGPVVNVLTCQLSHKSIQTRIAVLRWVLLLHVKTPNKVGLLATPVLIDQFLSRVVMTTS